MNELCVTFLTLCLCYWKDSGPMSSMTPLEEDEGIMRPRALSLRLVTSLLQVSKFFFGDSSPVLNRLPMSCSLMGLEINSKRTGQQEGVVEGELPSFGRKIRGLG